MCFPRCMAKVSFNQNVPVKHVIKPYYTNFYIIHYYETNMSHNLHINPEMNNKGANRPAHPLCKRQCIFVLYPKVEKRSRDDGVGFTLVEKTEYRFCLVTKILSNHM